MNLEFFDRLSIWLNLRSVLCIWDLKVNFIYVISKY